MGWRLAVGVTVMWVALAFLGDGLASLVLPALLASNPDRATAIGLISFAGLGLAVMRLWASATPDARLLLCSREGWTT
ncbi:MAG TPA: hypothetical protein VFN41_05405 [Candidatus Limnocylindrales bacterium]|nr:hypothetical protein [Candidatus Limnocylindrales bacterium]